MLHKLLHYLRNERRRKGLSQADVAALMGGTWKSRVARYESGVVPPTRVALDYEAILRKHVSNLLAGAFDEEHSKVRRHARELLQREATPNTARRSLRHKTLEEIAS
jgi:transcriptional regulator with XRE-family HTH domain